MTDQEHEEFESDLDEEIETKNIEYHFDNFLKNVLGSHDLYDVCTHCVTYALLATQRHIENRLEALNEESEPSGLNN